jgi:uncharacterized protein (DUF2384 family)
MDDRQVLKRIDALVEEEQLLRRRHEEEGEPLSDDERVRLERIKVRLDSAWDFLRQRRALRQYGFSPADAIPRGADTVERYDG